MSSYSGRLPSFTLHLMAAALLIGMVVLLTVIMYQVWPIGADYYFTFRPVAERFVSGETQLYDRQSLGFYNAPWTLLLLVPLTWFPLNAGQAILTTSTLVCLWIAIPLLRNQKRIPFYAVVLALANLHTFDLLIRGQVDGYILLAIALGFWSIQNRNPLGLTVGFWLMAIKPINVALAALLYFYAIRNWTRPKQIKAVSLPVVSLLVSFPLFGPDWPLRYIDNYQRYPPPSEQFELTLWRAASQLGIPRWPFLILGALCVAALIWLVRRDSLTEMTLSIVVATNLVFTPYATGNHYVYLVPAVIFITRRNWTLAVFAYVFTWTPLMRLSWGTDIAPIDMIYPAIILASAWYLALKDHAIAAIAPSPESVSA